MLVHLYRHTLRQDVCELPAGENDKNDKNDLVAAKRELLEETGYASDNFVDLGAYYVLPSETNRRVHFFLALDARKVQEPQLDNIVEKYFAMSVSVKPLKLFDTPQKAAQQNMTGMESLFGINLLQQYQANK